MAFLDFGIKHINRRVRIGGFKCVQDDLPLDGVALKFDVLASLLIIIINYNLTLSNTDSFVKYILHENL